MGQFGGYRPPSGPAGRARAKVDALALLDSIDHTKACGLANLPFDCAVNNDTWMRLCLAANDLLAWARRITCTGSLARATPKTIRHRLLSIAGRLTRTGRRLHLDSRWPWTTHLLNAIDRLRTAFQPPT